MNKKNATLNKMSSQEDANSFPPFEPSFSMALVRAKEAVMRRFIPSLQDNGLSPEQWRVMSALYRQNSLDISTLSELCYLLKPSLTRIIQNLERREIISRQKSDVDHRSSILDLTKKGCALYEHIIPVSEERYSYIVEKIGYERLQLLYELLEELMEKLNEDNDKDGS